MSTKKPPTATGARLKTGSSFKVPRNPKGSIQASTPRHPESTNATLSCDISAISLPPANKRVRHRPLPGAKASTPTQEEKDVTMSCDISSIQPSTAGVRRGAQTLPGPTVTAKKALCKSSNESQVQSKKTSKQMQLDTDYNNFLHAVVHNKHENEHNVDTKNQIEADLVALSKRLAANQLNLETTKQRLGKISFLTEQDRVLRTQREAMEQTLELVEGALEQKTSALADVLDSKTNHLDLKNVTIGTAELKRILADSNKVLNQLKASNAPFDSDRVTEVAKRLASSVENVALNQVRAERIDEKMPLYGAAPLVDYMTRKRDAGWNPLAQNKQDEDED